MKICKTTACFSLPVSITAAFVIFSAASPLSAATVYFSYPPSDKGSRTGPTPAETERKRQTSPAPDTRFYQAPVNRPAVQDQGASPSPESPVSKTRDVRTPRVAERSGTRSSTSSEPAEEFSKVSRPSDPIEVVNRGTFAVNHQLYRFIFRPLGKFTETVVPKPVLTAADNAFENIETPVRVVGSLLQGKPGRALKETEKLLINSTIGVGGLFKASDHVDSLKNVPAEDVGQAFGEWGIPQGPYVVIPVLGPSSCRDLPGKLADNFLSPIRWLHHKTLRYSLSGGRALEENPQQMRSYDQATQGSLDKYIAVREGYLSYRAEAVRR